MKKFILLAVVAVVTNVNAIELLSYKNTSTNVVKVDESELNKLWASNTPVCIKDGGKFLGNNQAFVDLKLGYSDCSASDKAREKQRMLGYQVVKIDFTSLPDNVAQDVAKKHGLKLK